ncbi:molybdopterin-binding protein [Streptomyces albiaxialis]|uniref:Molybdopterin molybdenumtransferase n=1 Tax=Streptomyces albiaxialis TaxID=329523 RepID=A0ABN2W8B2_9ACTN
MSGADELDEAIALANSGRTRPAAPPVPRLKRIRRIQWSETDVDAGQPEEEASVRRDHADGMTDGMTDGTAEGTADGAGALGGGTGGGSAGGPASGRDARKPGVAARTRRPERPSWAEARALAAGSPGALPRVTLPLDRALGHTLAGPLEALTDLPSFDTSAMDGWAVSGPGPWELVTEPIGTESKGILAGDRAEPAPLPDGHAIRIATGARIPPNTSAVLRSEHGATSGATRLRTARAPQPGTDIRPRGQECRTGDTLLPEGTHVTPAVLGLAAAAGYDELEVVRRPRAEVLVLGDELMHRGLPHDGRIRDALGPMVGPWLTTLGADVIVTRRLGDDAEALYETLATTTADVVVTTGGTAAGPVDHLQPTLRRLGAELLVHGVRVRPGHPMLLAALKKREAGGEGDGEDGRGARDGEGGEGGGGTFLVGLPGNPLAALSGLVTLAAPLLRTLGGRPGPGHEQQGTLAEEVHGHPRDTRLVPVAHEGAGVRARVRPLRYAGPSMLRGIATADALAVIPPGGAAPGTDVRLLELPR